ncbi:Cof-type HAD-IIB family hydrolase [Patescibacteria group bacterium]|nr:Cof-type HAD-IIB family hydrolase [Patescibacteria group bacterium]
MQSPQNYRHLFFDLDGTVTPSRSLIEPEMTEVLEKILASGRDVIIVSGAEVKQARYQTNNLPFYYLGQNGNHAYDGKTEKDMWRELLTQSEKDEVYAHIASIPRTWEVANEKDLIEDRNSQISYSLLGHHADKAKKSAFDPKGEFRQELLQKYPFVSNTMQVVIGGTTCFDYIKKGFHKGRNVTKLIQEMGWKKEECVYTGDALYAGGNDETVLGVIDTVQIANPAETLTFVRSVLA